MCPGVLSDTQAQLVSQETSVNLIVDGKVVRSATGSNSETLDGASFDMRSYAGKQAQIQIVDMNTAGWGHLLADQFTAADTPRGPSCSAPTGPTTARTTTRRCPGRTRRAASGT